MTPEKLKPVPLGAIDEMVSAELPELLSVSVSVLLLPVVTLPKFRLVGDAVSWLDVTPVPESDTFEVRLLPLEF